MTLYPEFRAELAEALVNRNRGDIADLVATLDDDQIAECLTLATSQAEGLLDSAVVSRRMSGGLGERREN